MRIGMMADVYKPHISGITHYISLNKKHLEMRGHSVFVFTFSEEEYEDDEERVVRSPGVPLLDTGYFISLRYSPAARRLLQTMDVVHVHHPFMSGSLARHYCQPSNIPIVFTNHTRYDLYSQAYLPPMADVIGLTAVKAYLPAFCRACNLVISPSHGMCEVLRNFGVDVPIEVVPNGVDLRRFQEAVVPTTRRELGIPEGNVVLVYVGRLGPEKNLPFLLRAYAATHQAYEKSNLLIIGDGPERQNLEMTAEQLHVRGSVIFLGSVKYDSLPPFLAAADAFVTASVTEVHPLTVIEAMAAGLPILGIRSPGVGDLIDDGITGLLVREEDLAGFTAKMVRMVIECDARKKMGENAREASRQYAIERTSGMMEEHYQRVIVDARSHRRGFRGRLGRFLGRNVR